MCSIENCDKPVHSKGLCQNHYRQAARAERGLKKPGPKPDPSKPRSRHGEARKNEGNGYFILEVGSTCKKGHTLGEDDIFYRRDKDRIKRTCRICYTEAYLRRTGQESMGVANANKTHCANGHAFSEENTAILADGSRRCRECNRIRAKEYWVRKYGEPGPHYQTLKTHCPQGHEYTEENTYRNSASRQCKTCIRERNLLRDFGITIAQYEEMLEAQGGVCWACKTAPTKKSLAVDHNHTTGAIRGLLCHPCNVALGLLREDRVIIASLVEYLDFYDALEETAQEEENNEA